MELVSCHFHSQEEAAKAISMLRQMGISNDQISVLTQHVPEKDGMSFAHVIKEGFATAVLSLVDLGTVMVGGPLMPILAETQNLTEGLTRHGVGKEQVDHHLSRVAQGEVLLTVATEKPGAKSIIDLLTQAGGFEVQQSG